MSLSTTFPKAASKDSMLAIAKHIGTAEIDSSERLGVTLLSSFEVSPFLQIPPFEISHQISLSFSFFHRSLFCCPTDVFWKKLRRISVRKRRVSTRV